MYFDRADARVGHFFSLVFFVFFFVIIAGHAFPTSASPKLRCRVFLPLNHVLPLRVRRAGHPVQVGEIKRVEGKFVLRLWIFNPTGRWTSFVETVEVLTRSVPLDSGATQDSSSGGVST